MIKAIIFDYDETLVKTLESRIPAYIDLASNEYNLTLTADKIRQTIGRPYQDFIYQLFGDVDKVESIIAKYQAIIDEYPMIPYEDSVTTVNELIKKNYLVGIVSGVRREALLFDMKHLGYDLYKFFHIQCGEDTIFHKPNPKVFDPLVVKLKSKLIKNHEVVYVGDNLEDASAANKANFNFLGIANHTTDAKVFESNHISYVLSFKEMMTTLNT